MPEYPQAPLPPLNLGQSFESVVHAEVLVIFGHYLDLPAGRIHEQGEILHQVQKPGRLAGAPEHRLQGDAPLLGLAFYLLPLGKVFPARSDAAYPTLAAVREDDQRVVPEKMRDSILVINKVAGKSALQPPVSSLELNKKKRQAVDKAHQVSPSGVHLTGNPELRAEQEIVVQGIVPVDYPHRLDPFTPLGV